ncbi:MAG TPA: tetratricopeptide repeat protein [Candidatus Dormibacteraeota bacterium]|nr:tetratricopeptide repeat protein [Candidatus Dormibacteraeota bacterium]
MTHASDGAEPVTRRRGRRHGVEIRPGSVKEARTKAGLSLGQVARGDISRTAIYFVETGKAKPSKETLELIASRTGQPIDFFLTGADSTARHPEIRIAELERLLATGDNAAVASAAEAALAQGYDPESEARIKLLASMAWLRLAKPVLGRRLAVQARTYFEKAGDLERVAEALGHEAQAAGLMQDSTAVQIAEGALATCRSLKPIPKLLEARLLRVLGHQLLNSERWTEAITCYDEAIATGEIVQDLQQLSLLYSGMSLAHQELGEINQATRYAQKALTIHETLHDRLSQARSLNNLGWMLVKLRDFAAARTHLDRALRMFEEQHVEVGKSEVLMSLAVLEVEEGRLETAAATARRSLELATRLGEVSTAADGYVLIGQIAARRGRNSDADEAFAQALFYGERAAAGKLSEVHEAYAEVLEARSDLPGANRHLKLALTARRPVSPAQEIRTATA